MRLPARFAATATVAANPNSDLFVAGWTPRRPEAPPVQAFTAMLCDGGAHHYFHFMEAMIWLFALQRQFLPGAVLRRIVFAWPWDNPAQNHVQRSVLAALAPGVEIADPGWAWPATLDDVLIIDRSWAQTGINKFLEAAMPFAPPWTQQIGRMARAAVRAGASPRMVSAGSAPSTLCASALPHTVCADPVPELVCADPAQRPGLRILYVPRQPPRCLSAAAEAALLHLLRQHGDVSVCDFGTVPWEQQVRLSAAHDVMVGVHGNGLTNAVWMHPGSLVLELFPARVHHYDYQLFAELCGLAYFGFERDRVFPAFSRTGKAYGHGEPSNRRVTAIPQAALSRALLAHGALRSVVPASSP